MPAGHEPDPGRRDQPAWPDQKTPDRWSAADLRDRLTRLPPGHPSSPFHADRSRKPPPPDLRKLELSYPDEHPGAAGRP